MKNLNHREDINRGHYIKNIKFIKIKKSNSLFIDFWFKIK